MISDPFGPVGGPNVTTANFWRWQYARPPEVHTPGPDVARMVAPVLAAGADRRRQNQQHLKRTTGFPGGNAELGHQVLWALREKYSPTVARVAAHLAAITGAYNFQGNRRLAFWCRVSDRTVRRARAELERDGLISSYLLLPGDMVLGQKAPVTRPQVVRDVAKLQRLARVRGAFREPRNTKKERREPSAAEVPAPDATPTPEHFEALARRNPELSAHFLIMAEAARKKRDPKPVKPPPNAAPLMSKEEIDAVEAGFPDAVATELDRQERELCRQLGVRWKPPDDN